MVRILSAVLVLSAVTASAKPAIPSFEHSAAQLQASVAALRAAQVQAKGASSGPQISAMTWDLERYGRDISGMRDDLRWLQQRLRRQGNAQPGRPGQPGQPSDPSLRWDVQRLTRDLAQLSRDAQWRLNDLRFLASSAEKDETLVPAATRLLDAARRLKSDTNWFAMDARFAYWDFQRAGYTFEAMDIDRNSRDVDTNAQNLETEADRLLAKVRP
ncbi:MAG: hypothetical protein Q8T11_01450 [Elusimicrobiota bacterium]|nr:hypothetical protein [Elusimicrobiota bacterium]